MDYETKPTNRKELRLYAKLFRSICKLSNTKPIDPVELLDRLPDLEGFENVRYEIVYNDENFGEYKVDKTHKLNITCNAVIRESTYTIGITDEYDKLLKNPNIFMYNINDR